MALVYSCGFDQFADEAGLSDLFANVPSTGNVDLLTTSGAFGDQCLSCLTDVDPEGATGVQTNIFPVATTQRGSASNPFHCAFWIKAASALTGSRHFMTIGSSIDGGQLRLFWDNTAGVITVNMYDSASAAAAGATTTDIDDQAWHHIEIALTVVDTTGSLEVWVDGTKEVNLTSTDTYEAGTFANDLDYLAFSGHRSGVDILYDDIICWDEEGTGLVTTGQLGLHRIEVIHPTSEGNSSDFTPQSGTDNSAMVDETSAADGDTTYVESSTINHQELYGMGDSTFTNPESIIGVAIHTRAQYQAAGTPILTGRCRNGTTEANAEGPTNTLTAAYADHLGFFDTDPDTASAWADVADINAAEFGFVAGTVGDTARVTQFYAEVITDSVEAAKIMDANVNRTNSAIMGP
jgi:hypothetical protein